MPAGFEGSIKAREVELLPVYRQVLHLCDRHLVYVPL